jgi:ferredoxin--NADP+ reductase
MTQSNLLAPEEIKQLREQQYNARVESIDSSHADLMRIRVRPDGEPIAFEPGQYTVLGLGGWEPRVANTQEEPLDDSHLRKLIRRAYSFSCRMVDEHGGLVAPNDDGALEFYLALVREAEASPPALTPRLFRLAVGDRLHVGRKVAGHYTLEPVKPDDHVIFAATGTGEAPHNAMLAELLSRGHEGQITMVTCVRRRSDLSYVKEHRWLEKMHANYRYLTLTTREPENLDPNLPGYVGKQYLQDYFESGQLERDCGCETKLGSTHVFLCGNPDMIGVPHRTYDPQRRYPTPRGMVEVLEKLGFRIDQPHDPGDIHFEKYW